MASMFAEYSMELEGKGTVEDDHGFFTYKITGDECFIADVYIKKESRLLGHGKRLARAVEAIAKEAGCRYLTCSCTPSLNGSTDSMRAILSYGFRLHSSVPDRVNFIKEIL